RNGNARWASGSGSTAGKTVNGWWAGPGPGGNGRARRSGPGEAGLLGDDGVDQGVDGRDTQQGQQGADPLGGVLEGGGGRDGLGLRVLDLVPGPHAVGDPRGPGGDGRDLAGSLVRAAQLLDH